MSTDIRNAVLNITEFTRWVLAETPETARDGFQAAQSDEETERTLFESAKSQYETFNAKLQALTAELGSVREAQESQGEADCLRALGDSPEGRIKLAGEIAGRESTRALLEQTVKHGHKVLGPRLNLAQMEAQERWFAAKATSSSYLALIQGIRAFRAAEQLALAEGAINLFQPGQGLTDAIRQEAIRLWGVARSASAWIAEERQRQRQTRETGK